MIKDTTRVEPEFESLTDDDTEAKSIATTTDVSAHSKFASLETDTIIPNIINIDFFFCVIVRYTFV